MENNFQCKCYFSFTSKACWLIILAICLLAASCARNEETRWNEKIILHDGKMIVVSRYEIRNPSGFPISKRGRIIEQGFSYKPMNVKWDYPGTGVTPVAFDIINGKAYLVIASGSYWTFCNNRKKGDYIAFFYEWGNGQKRSISQADLPLAVINKNLSDESERKLNNLSKNTINNQTTNEMLASDASVKLSYFFDSHALFVCHKFFHKEIKCLFQTLNTRFWLQMSMAHKM